MLAEMATKLDAARLLVHRAAVMKDQGHRCDMEAGMTKYFASEVAQEIALMAVRIHGGYGYSKEFDVERYYRDTPLMIVGEGTNEIQKNVIARQPTREPQSGRSVRFLQLARLRGIKIMTERNSVDRSGYPQVVPNQDFAGKNAWL